MLLDVLSAVMMSMVLDRVVVVSGDDEALDLASEQGAETIFEQRPKGMNAAFALGMSCLPEDTQVLALIPCDLPLLRAEDVAFLVGRALEGPRVVLVPSATSPGTSILVTNPPGIIPLHFEEDSYRLHYREAVKVGDAEVYWIEAGLDVDEAEDLIHLLRSQRRCRTRELLRSWRLAERMRPSGGS
jgi:2-phospho-L-lactate guanylyltransferase